MTNTSADRRQGINPSLLFWASCVALIATAMSFAIRGDVMTDLETQFDLTKQQNGWIFSAAFWSFGLFIFLGGPLVDRLGMGLLLRIAAICHVLGALLTMFAPNFTTLFLGTFVIGAGNGLVEAVCNPLVASIYPDEKAHKLTLFHAWFPGGIVIGGLLCFAFSKIGTPYLAGESISMLGGISLWKIKTAALVIPAIIYFLMIMKAKFPPTERAAAGVPFSEMFVEVLRRPLFWIVFAMMWLTASTELVPGAWIKNIYDDVMGDVTGAGILFLVWGSGLMWALRQFASKPIHKMSPVLLITCTAPLCVVGLLMFQYVGESKLLFFVAATLLYVGFCFWWPTMLAIANERCPKTGALGLAIIGGTGSIATAASNPVFGGIIDRSKVSLAAGGMAEEMATKAAPLDALQIWAVLPAVLFVVFLLVHLKDLSAGGYKAEKLETTE